MINDESAGFFRADEFAVSTADSEAAQGELSGRHHVAFQAKSGEMVDLFYKQTLAHGGKDDGAPGEQPYHPGYHVAFVIDPNGNNIEAVYHGEAKQNADAIHITF